MIKDAEAHADDDKRRREEVVVRNTADATAYQLEKQLSDLGSNAPSNEKARAEQLIAEIRGLLNNEALDLTKVRQLTSDLQQVAHSLASAAHGQATVAGAARGANGEGSAGKDDVIDAEFKQT
jgi:molecular chaperone DnaK